MTTNKQFFDSLDRRGFDPVQTPWDLGYMDDFPLEEVTIHQGEVIVSIIGWERWTPHRQPNGKRVTYKFID
jgi:hypothetical protein